MRERKRNGSKLFLTELMIAIFFFAVVIAICIQLFSNSYTMSRDSRRLTEAVNISSNLAEYYYGWDGERDSLTAAFPMGHYEDESFIIEYDDDFHEVASGGRYYARVDFSREGRLETAYISVNKSDAELIYGIKVERIVNE